MSTDARGMGGEENENESARARARESVQESGEIETERVEKGGKRNGRES